VDEVPLPRELPQDYVLRIAQAKANVARVLASPEGVIIVADTTVAYQNQILGKPKDSQEARRMLKLLRGCTHQVFTALTVLDIPSQNTISDLASTDVPMRAYTNAEIEAYIASGDPFDKAGGYAIQHSGFNPALLRSGCYANVVGLPLCHLARILSQVDIPATQNIPSGCLQAFSYRCTTYIQIYQGVP
jgi:MAF protein